ncbi:MAG TPA: SDR family oxidoreductase [Thermomicrobiales bacterium]|nr:SDR family oxidoreductase [Thermomicrobiales bacterium]
MDTGLSGKVAVVTAASAGLGKAVATAFGAEGANVVMCSRSQERVEAAAADVRDRGADVLALEADVTRPEDIERLFSAAVERFGGVDVLVTNAGGPPAGTFDRFDDDDWQRAFELTLMSAVRLIRRAIPEMRARGGGSIVVMTSSSIKQPIPNLLLSNVMRAGVAALAKTLADELAGDNIRVNTLVPGRIATQRIEELDRANAERQGVDVETVTRQQLASIPMGRYGDPAEFAAGAVFLASDAASYITGATLQVDGGMIRSLW